MIQRFQFGHPEIPTDTVIESVPVSKNLPDWLEVSQSSKNEDNPVKVSLACSMDSRDAVYGLGENINGINKRGFTYISRCMDGSRHTEDRTSLYASHNFLIVKGKRTFGLFIDSPGIVSFDLGESDMNKMIITCDDPDFDLYLITGDSLNDIVRQFRKMIGTSYIPPKWAFGYQQSRWLYKNEEDFREIARNYRKNNIPLDAINMDIDYMDGYKSFTINETAFPDFEGLVKEMKDDGIHLIPIIDAGIKVEPGYDVYEEGIAQNRFCKGADGKEFKVGVWPGWCHLVDVMDPDNRKWFGSKYSVLLDKGIDGIWNDMNEPSIFYTAERLNDAYAMVDELRSQELDLGKYFGMRKKFSSLSSNPEDYKLFYHTINGRQIPHSRVHNLYGYNITRAAGEAFETLSPEKRLLLFSRSSMIGMHRTSGIWTGDNMAWWSHLKLNMQQLPGINMCGFLYAGADLGGFGSDTNEQLITRWVEFGLFAPLMRNHSQSRRAQELYTFNNTDTFRKLIELRYALIPYIYSEFVKAALNNDLYFKPLAFAYEDDLRAAEVEDQLMVGESMMIAPVYTQNARGRYVYLPEDMKMIRYRSLDDYDEEILRKGDHYIPVELDELIFFIRPNHLIPLAKPAASTKDMDFDNLSVLGWMPEGKQAQYLLYDDDGLTRDISRPEHFHTITADNNSVSCSTKNVTYHTAA